MIGFPYRPRSTGESIINRSSSNMRAHSAAFSTHVAWDAAWGAEVGIGVPVAWGVAGPDGNVGVAVDVGVVGVA